MKFLFLIILTLSLEVIISLKLNPDINSLHNSLSSGYKIIPTDNNINEMHLTQNQINQSNKQNSIDLYNAIKNNDLFNRGINSAINFTIYNRDKDISYVNISKGNFELCNESQITEKKYPIYKKDSLPYYTPINIPTQEINGISVEVKYGDLSMEIPSPDNLNKLYSELRRLKSMQSSDIYYDSSRSEIESQINFYKDKIKEMEFKLKNEDLINSKEQTNEYLQSQLQNVTIVKEIGNIPNKDYYKDEKKTIVNAEEGRSILGEKYDQTETYK